MLLPMVPKNWFFSAEVLNGVGSWEFVSHLIAFLPAYSHGTFLLFWSQSGFCFSCKCKYPTAELSFAISPFPPSGEALMSLQWSKTHRSSATEQMSLAESKNTHSLQKHSFSHTCSWVLCLKNTLQTRRLCSLPFACELKRETCLIESVQEREGLISYSVPDPLAASGWKPASSPPIAGQ